MDIREHDQADGTHSVIVVAWANKAAKNYICRWLHSLVPGTATGLTGLKGARFNHVHFSSR